MGQFGVALPAVRGKFLGAGVVQKPGPEGYHPALEKPSDITGLP